MASDSGEDYQLQELHALTRTSGAEAVFVVDTNVLMRLPAPWEAPARGTRAPIFAIAQYTYEEIVKMAREPRRKNEPEHVEERRRLASTVLRWIGPSLETGELHRGMIRDDGNWILLSGLRSDLDPVTAKYFGEADAGLLGTTSQLQSQNWMPPVSIISGDVGVRFVALGRRIKCLEPKDALDSAAVRSWLDSTSSSLAAPITVRSMLEAAPKLRIAEIDLGLEEFPPRNPADLQLKVNSETITVAVHFAKVVSEDVFATKAIGWGLFLGRQLAGSFFLEATTSNTDEGRIAATRVIEFQGADSIPAYVVESIRDAVQSLLSTRLYPPHHVARAWFEAKFSENGLDPLEAWLWVSEAFDFELSNFGQVHAALEECENRWPHLNWPDAFEFVYDVMHRICPGETVIIKLAQETTPHA